MDLTTLILVVQVLFVLLVAIWGATALSLFNRRRESRKQGEIERLFADLVSQYLYPLPGEQYNLIEVQRAFRRAGVVAYKPRNVQYLIDLMIRSQRSLLGSNYQKLRVLFKQIPPYRVSVRKLESRKWYIKARGIQEIYEMSQEQYIRQIIKERNNPNIFVRHEAQIAMVVFLGWESLRFLPYLSTKLTLWQQIKIIEKLYSLHPQPDVEYLRQAFDAERPYAQKLIMRIIRKFGLKSEVDYIMSFLDHENNDRRETAIYCISSFALDHGRLADIKRIFFKISDTRQQMKLLQYIHEVSPAIDLLFFREVLKKGHEDLKLSTAEILWSGGYQREVEEFYYKQYKEPLAAESW